MIFIMFFIFFTSEGNQNCTQEKDEVTVCFVPVQINFPTSCL